MLNQQIDPQNITRADFEKHVDALQEAISKHYHINTQKRGKLRDVAAMTLFGCENGYQQLLTQLKATPEPVPLPDSYMELPSEINLVTDCVFSELVVFGPGQWVRKQYVLDDFIHAVIDEYCTWSEEDEQAVVFYKKDGYNQIDLSRSQVMRQIHHDYVIDEIEVTMPRIDRYGVSPLSRTDEMREMLIEHLIDTSHLDNCQLEDLMLMQDSGDDSSGSVRIKLTKKVS